MVSFLARGVLTPREYGASSENPNAIFAVFPSSSGASPGAPFSPEVQSMVSDCFPRMAAIGRGFPQFARKASAFWPKVTALSIKDA
jgi:hypothetical protein